MKASYAPSNQNDPSNVEITTVDVSTAEEFFRLRGTVQTLDSGSPAIDLVDDSQAGLTFATTTGGIALSLIAPGGDHSYHAINPDCHADDDESPLFSFTYMGSYSEVPQSCLVPLPTARRIVEAYFAGGLDAALLAADWEADW